MVRHAVVEFDQARDHRGVAREALRPRDTARVHRLRQRLPLPGDGAPVAADARVVDATGQLRLEALHRLLHLGSPGLALGLCIGLAAQHGGCHAAVDLCQTHHLQQRLRRRQASTLGLDGGESRQCAAHVGRQWHGHQQGSHQSQQHELVDQAKVADQGRHGGAIEGWNVVPLSTASPAN